MPGPKRREKQMVSESMTSPRALICEDVGVTVLQIRKALLKAGYQVVGEAVEGRKAVEMANELKPDLILMDINMPGPMDGIPRPRKFCLNFQFQSSCSPRTVTTTMWTWRSMP